MLRRGFIFVLITISSFVLVACENAEKKEALDILEETEYDIHLVESYVSQMYQNLIEAYEYGVDSLEYTKISKSGLAGELTLYKNELTGDYCDVFGTSLESSATPYFCVLDSYDDQGDLRSSWNSRNETVKENIAEAEDLSSSEEVQEITSVMTAHLNDLDDLRKQALNADTMSGISGLYTKEAELDQYFDDFDSSLSSHFND